MDYSSCGLTVPPAFDFPRSVLRKWDQISPPDSWFHNSSIIIILIIIMYCNLGLWSWAHFSAIPRFVWIVLPFRSKWILRGYSFGNTLLNLTHLAQLSSTDPLTRFWTMGCSLGRMLKQAPMSSPLLTSAHIPLKTLKLIHIHISWGIRFRIETGACVSKELLLDWGCRLEKRWKALLSDFKKYSSDVIKLSLIFKIMTSGPPFFWVDERTSALRSSDSASLVSFLIVLRPLYGHPSCWYSRKRIFTSL